LIREKRTGIYVACIDIVARELAPQVFKILGADLLTDIWFGNRQQFCVGEDRVAAQ
jgi:hypothetical protein